MAYVPITTAEITTGEPVANTTQTKIKDNFIAHETRIASLEGGSSSVYPPVIFRVNGVYADVIATGLLKTTINFNLTVTGVRLLIDQAGTVGTTTIDIRYKRGAGAYTSVLSTKPSVLFSAGSDSISTNAVLDPTQVNLLAGDIIALDITSAQTAAKNFIVRLDFSKT